MNELPLYAAEDIEVSGFMARGIDTLLVRIADWFDGQISMLVGLAVLDQYTAISTRPVVTNDESAPTSVQ